VDDAAGDVDQAAHRLEHDADAVAQHARIVLGERVVGQAQRARRSRRRAG